MRQLQITICSAVLALVGIGSLPSAASAEYCYDFQGDATGDYGSPMNRFVGFIDATWSFENLATCSGSACQFEVDTGWGSTGNKFLHPYGNPVSVKIVPRVGGGSDRPTAFEMVLGAYNGDVDVAAYDASGGVIWSDTFAANDDHLVSITGVGAIDHVKVSGGDREVYMDDICIA